MNTFYNTCNIPIPSFIEEDAHDKDFFNFFYSRLGSGVVAIVGAAGVGLITVGILGAVGVFPPAAGIVVAAIIVIAAAILVGTANGNWASLVFALIAIPVISLGTFIIGIAGMILGPEKIQQLHEKFSEDPSLQMQEECREYITRNQAYIKNCLNPRIKKNTETIQEICTKFSNPITLTPEFIAENKDELQIYTEKMGLLKDLQNKNENYQHALQQLELAVAALAESKDTD